MRKLLFFAAICLSAAFTVQGSNVATETVNNTGVEKFSAIDNVMITPVIINDYNFGGNGFDVCAVQVENFVFDFGRPVLFGIQPKLDFGSTRPVKATKHRYRCNDPPDLLNS